MWPLNRAQKPICELSPANIHAGAVIGENWVEIAIIHGDPRGRICGLRSRDVRIDTHLTLSPSIQDVLRGLGTCWRSVTEGPALEYENFVLCLPPWACRSRRAGARIPIEHDPQVPRHRLPVVTPHHVRALEEKVCRKAGLSEDVVIEFVPHAYVLDSGRRVSNPVGETTRTLQLDAHVVLAERSPVMQILNFLHSLGLSVDVLVSPEVATGGILSRTEREIGAAVIDMDARQTLCSFYQNGTLHHSAQLELGCDHVHHAIAARHDLSIDDVRSFTCDMDHLVVPEETNHRIKGLPLFAWTPSHPQVNQFKLSATPTVQRLVEQLLQALNVAQREMMVDVRKLVLTGDDPLVLRVLMDMATDLVGVPCRIARGWARDEDEGRIQTHERTAMCLRRYAQVRRGRQPFLERYNESVLDAMSRAVRIKTREIAWLTARRLFNTQLLRDEDQVPASTQPLRLTQRVTSAGGYRALDSARSGIELH